MGSISQKPPAISTQACATRSSPRTRRNRGRAPARGSPRRRRRTQPDLESSASEDRTPSAGRGSLVRTAGRRKIRIEYIPDKNRRHITFSKRKHGIMKKAYEISTLCGTQTLLIIASETGHVYTFATAKMQPLIGRDEGKGLIQSLLRAQTEQHVEAAMEEAASLGQSMDNTTTVQPPGPSLPSVLSAPSAQMRYTNPPRAVVHSRSRPAPRLDPPPPSRPRTNTVKQEPEERWTGPMMGAGAGDGEDENGFF